MNQRDMAKQLPTPLRLIARMNFSLKNYSYELFNLIGTVEIVELISTFTTAVCESWKVSDKYTWDNAGDLKLLSMDQTLSKDNKSDYKAVFFFHMVTHVFDNSNLSQDIFAIDTWRAVICSLGHGRKHMLTILPTIWKRGLIVFKDNFFGIQHRAVVVVASQARVVVAAHCYQNRDKV